MLVVSGAATMNAPAPSSIRGGEHGHEINDIPHIQRHPHHGRHLHRRQSSHGRRSNHRIVVGNAAVDPPKSAGSGGGGQNGGDPVPVPVPSKLARKRSAGGGNGSGSGSSKAMLQKISREQRGMCAECGARTHEFRTDNATGICIKEPLTIEGKVRRGRCLECHPLPAGGAPPLVDGSLALGMAPPVASVAIDERVERWRRHRLKQQLQEQQEGGRGSFGPLRRSNSLPRAGASSFRSASVSTLGTVSTLGNGTVSTTGNNTVSTLGFDADHGDGRSVTSSSGVTIKRIRERRGLCAECGARTHEFAADGAKMPLTVDGEVRRGRCLHCHPLPQMTAAARAAEHQHDQQHQQQQHHRSGRGRSRSLGDQNDANFGGCDAPELLRRRKASRSRERPHRRSSSAGQRPREPLITIDGAATDSNPDPENRNKQPRHRGGGGGKSQNPDRRNSFCSTVSAVSSCDMDSIKSEHTSESVRAKRAADAELAAVERMARMATSAAVGARNSMAASSAAPATSSGGGGSSSDLCDIIATMRQYPANVEIQESGCRKLWSQSRRASDSTAIGRAGGIPTILNAMRTHGPYSRSLLLMGCEALQNLARHSDYNRRVIQEGGGVGAVLRGMEIHRRVIGVQVCGIAVLAGIGEPRRRGEGRWGGGAGGSGNNVGGDDHDIAGTVASPDEAAMLCAVRGAIEAFPQEERVLRSAYKTLKALGFKPMEVLARWQEEKEGG